MRITKRLRRQLALKTFSNGCEGSQAGSLWLSDGHPASLPVPFAALVHFLALGLLPPLSLREWPLDVYTVSVLVVSLS